MATKGAGGTIMIVDDEPDFRLILGKLLTFVGYRVLEAGDGNEALARLRQERVDLVLTDWMMPGMDGEALCQEIKADARLRNTYVIMVTAKGRSEDVAKGLDTGADDYLVKPVDRMELLARVRAGLRVGQLQRDLAEQLRQKLTEQARSAAILSNVADAIILSDAEGCLLNFNRAAEQVFGLSSEHCLGRTIQALENREIAQLFHQALQEGSAVGEVEMANGKTYYARWTAVSLPNSDDESSRLGWVATMQDITHFKKLDQLKSEMVAQVAHDLKSPLMTIYGYAELLQMSGELDETQTQSAQHIMQGVERIRALVDDLLDLERIEHGMLSQEDCDLPTVVEEASDQFVEQAQHNRINFEVDIPQGTLMLVGDRTRIRQAVVNLLNNAFKYTPEGGTVRLSVEAAGNALVVNVTDTGPGVPPDSLPRLFGRFYRVPGQPKWTGTGLGLAIVKSVAEAHGGRAWVESTLGQGSTFHISFPAAPLTVEDAVSINGRSQVQAG